MTKPTWIFVAGTYRTGSTTQYQITRNIVEETKNGIGIAYHTEEKLREFDNTNHKFIVCKVFAPLWEYFYNVHEGMKKQESYGKVIYHENRLKAVVSIRNPYDIMTSIKRRSQDKPEFNFHHTATEELPRWLSDLTKWIDLGDLTYWSKFEDFTKHLPKETANIAGHLGIELSGDDHHKIGNRFKIDELNRRKGEYNKPDENEKRHLPSVPGIIFGTSGQWQQWLTRPEQKAVYEANRGFFERFNY